MLLLQISRTYLALLHVAVGIYLRARGGWTARIQRKASTLVYWVGTCFLGWQAWICDRRGKSPLPIERRTGSEGADVVVMANAGGACPPRVVAATCLPSAWQELRSR